MTVTSYPGVYVEELPGGARVIEAAGTSTAVFFGVADKGPVDKMRKIFNFNEFKKHYGDFRADGQFLAHSVFQFFNNGGKECYIGRVASGAGVPYDPRPEVIHANPVHTPPARPPRRRGGPA